MSPAPESTRSVLAPQGPAPGDPGATTAGPPSVGPEPRPVAAPPGFEIEGELGRGGMGVVYRARQTRLNRSVALKMILAGGHAGPAERIRFLAEAEAVAAVQHPGIVQVYAFGTVGDQPYFALEFCPGGSLAAKLAGTPLPPSEAADLVERIARSVEAAHAAGIVHRDLKPDNVLFAADGGPKVTDFGLARNVETDRGLTKTGVIMGTPSYMAPEQATGQKDVGPAADVWALGAILYECLTGRPPFRAATALDTVLQVASDDPVPPRRLVPNLPRDVEVICLKCLRKEVPERYASAADLAADLRRWLAGEPIAARPVPAVVRGWKWAKRNRAVAAALAAMAVGTVVSVAFAVSADRAAGFAGERAAAAAAAEDLARGNEATARAREAEARRLLGHVATQEGLRLADAGDLVGGLLWFAEALRADPDDPAAARANRQRIAAYRAYLPRFRLADEFIPPAEYEAVYFSADRTSAVLTPQSGPYRVWDARAGRLLPGVVGDAATHHFADISPDGRRVAFRRTEKPVEFTDAAGKVPGPGKPQAVEVFDLATGRPVGPPLWHETEVTSAVFNPDGSRLVTEHRDDVARVWDLSTGRSAPLPFNKVAATSPAAGPGRHVLGATAATGTTPAVALVWDAVGGRPVSPTLEFPVAVDVWVFREDGRQVAAGGRSAARVWDLPSGKPVAPVLPLGGPADLIDLSRDGARLLTGSGVNAQLWDVNAGRPVGPPLRHDGRVWSSAFSPDGAWVATAGLDRAVRVWDGRVGEPAGPPLRSAGDVWGLRFSPDGSRVEATAGAVSARVWDLTPVVRRPVTVSPGGKMYGATFALAGDRLLTLEEAEASMATQEWDAITGQPATGATAHTGWVREEFAGPDGFRVIVGTTEETNVVWVADAGTGRRLSAPVRHDKPIYAAAASRDGRVFVTREFGGRAVRVWDAETGRAVGVVEVGEEVVSAGLGPDGRRMWVRTPTRTVVRDVAGAARDGPPLPDTPAGYNSLSPDGLRILLAGPGGTRVWDVPTGAPVSPPFGRGARVTNTEFDPTGTRVATASDDHTVRVWDAVGLPVTPRLGLGGESVELGFGPAGRRVMGVTEAHVRVWELRADDRPVGDLVRLAELGAGHRIDESRGPVPLTAAELRDRWADLRTKCPDEFAPTPPIRETAPAPRPVDRL